jgi:hypothetical protein
MMRQCIPVLLALVAGCHTSPSPESYDLARRPNGIHGTLESRAGRSIAGELLEVRDSAFVMLVGDRVTIVPYRAIANASFDHQDWAAFQTLTPTPSAEARERIRWDSRFPYGMRPPALAALLRLSGQTEPDVVTGSP